MSDDILTIMGLFIMFPWELSNQQVSFVGHLGGFIYHVGLHLSSGMYRASLTAVRTRQIKTAFTPDPGDFYGSVTSFRFYTPAVAVHDHTSPPYYRCYAFPINSVAFDLMSPMPLWKNPTYVPPSPGIFFCIFISLTNE
jgi:hypothetical protein